jgi:hypothetical protein
MKRIVLAATVTAFLLPVSAFAALVAYEYEGTSDDGAWAVSGSIVFDEGDLVADEELIDKIVSWEFNWTNGLETISTSSEVSSIIGGGDPNGPPLPTFIIDETHTIIAFQFENDSGPNRYPLIGFEFNGARFSISVVPNECCEQGNGSFSGPETIVEFVDVDIKPGGGENCNAVIPVAVLGSATFDATEIDLSTLTFAGASAREKGNGALSCNASDVNSDGFVDLVCQYQNVTAEGAILGTLNDGTAIQGSDVYCVTP